MFKFRTEASERKSLTLHKLDTLNQAHVSWKVLLDSIFVETQKVNEA